MHLSGLHQIKSFSRLIILLTNSGNKAAKGFYFRDIQTIQLKRGISPRDVKIVPQLGIITPLHARWIVKLYTHMQKGQEKIINGFKSAKTT